MKAPKINNCMQSAKTMWEARPLASVIVFFAMGIAVGYHWLPGVIALFLVLALSLGLLLVGLGFRRYPLFLPAAFCIGILWLGVNYGPIANFQVDSGSRVQVTGEIVELDVDNDRRFSFVLQPEKGSGWPGRLVVYVRNPKDGKASDFTYGDHVTVTGTLRSNGITNPGVFDYTQYLRERNIVASLFVYQEDSLEQSGENIGNPIIKLALRCKEQIQTNLAELPPKLRGYAEGILFGDKSGISQKDKSILSRSGIMHIFAVSGLHIGFVLLLSCGLAKFLKLKRWLYLLVALFPAVIYGAMAGFTPSVCRALIMASVGLTAYVIGDESDTYTALALAGLVLLLIRPTVLLDVGFQLSFVAVLGILYLAPLFQRSLPRCYGLGPLLALSIAAQLAVTPIIAHSFHILTILGVFLSPIAVAVAAITVVGSLLSLPLVLLGAGSFYMYGVGVLIQGIVSLSQMCLNLPYFWQRVLAPAMVLILIYYGVLLLLPHLSKPKLPRVKCWSLVLLLLLVVALPSRAASGLLSLTYLDVGEGASMVIETPAGKTILIDGGGTNADPSSTGYFVVEPYLADAGVKELALMINTHPHADHGGGLLAILNEIPTQQLLLAQGTDQEFLTAELLTEADHNQVPVSFLTTGDILNLDDEVTLEVLSGGGNGVTVNDNTLVMLLRYREMDFLITSDAGEEMLRKLPLEDPAEIEVVEMAHHGSPTSFSKELYDAYQPEAVMITVGAENSYGHPAPELLSYWQQRGVPIYRTDRNGAVSFITDGATLTVEPVLQ